MMTGAAGHLLKLSIACRVVAVAVGIDDGLYVERRLFGFVDDALHLRRRIDHPRIPCLLAADR